MPRSLAATHWYLPACESWTGQMCRRLDTRSDIPSPGGSTAVSTSCVGSSCNHHQLAVAFVPSSQQTDLSAIYSQTNVKNSFPFSALTLLVGRLGRSFNLQKVGCWFVGDDDFSFAQLIAPVVTILPSSLASIKPANPGSPGKWPLERRQREKC